MKKRTNIELIAPTVEQAIEEGISKLGVSRDDVEVEILDEGKTGLFGLGSRLARIRMTIRNSGDGYLETEEPLDTPEKGREAQDTIDAQAGELEKVAQVESESEISDDEYVLETARAIVNELITKMKVKATVRAEYGDTANSRNRIPIFVNISGDDLSILIGKRAEILNDIQYISSLILGKELGKSVPLIVDVEGYRSRREKQLRQIANRIADQVISSGRRHALEAMPANERRIIHIELRDHPDIYTESFGDGYKRKVSIIPRS